MWTPCYCRCKRKWWIALRARVSRFGHTAPAPIRLGAPQIALSVPGEAPILSMLLEALPKVMDCAPLLITHWSFALRCCAVRVGTRQCEWRVPTRTAQQRNANDQCVIRSVLRPIRTVYREDLNFYLLACNISALRYDTTRYIYYYSRNRTRSTHNIHIAYNKTKNIKRY